MKIILTGVKELTDNKQQEAGQSLLMGLYQVGIDVEHVKVEFEGEDS